MSLRFKYNGVAEKFRPQIRAALANRPELTEAQKVRVRRIKRFGAAQLADGPCDDLLVVNFYGADCEHIAKLCSPTKRFAK